MSVIKVPTKQAIGIGTSIGWMGWPEILAVERGLETIGPVCTVCGWKTPLAWPSSSSEYELTARRIGGTANGDFGTGVRNKAMGSRNRSFGRGFVDYLAENFHERQTDRRQARPEGQGQTDTPVRLRPQPGW